MHTRSIAIVAISLIGAAEIGTPAHGQTAGERAYVTRVVDGNVIYAALGERLEAVRYIGVAVPFIAHPTRGRQPYADVVLEMNRRLVEGRWIRLTLDAQRRDGDGRLLAYVWVDDLFVNATLLHRGYAEAERAAVNTRYATYFQSLEADARLAGRGLWGYADVLAYHRARAVESTSDAGNVDEQPATAAGGRVFSSPNPITPTSVPAPTLLPESPGAGIPGGASRGSGFLPTRPEPRRWPQPGTTYMPVPGMR
jgi:endonuclease YncB( thermonuclease family)